jgi:hypothetical protein
MGNLERGLRERGTVIERRQKMGSWPSHLQIVCPSSGERGGGYLELDRIRSLQSPFP